MADRTTTASGDATNDAARAYEPTEAELDEWAARERRRREAWLAGPSEEERAAYAQRLRQRRLAATFDEGEQVLEEKLRLGLHASREAQLAAEGAMTLLYRWSRRTFADLVKAGREWEEQTSLPTARRRVPLDDEPE